MSPLGRILLRSRQCCPPVLVLLLVAGGSSAHERIRVSVAARALQPGELAVVTISLPGVASDLRVTAFRREIPTFTTGPHTHRALVGIDLSVAPGTYPVVVTARDRDREQRTIHNLRVRAKRFPTRRLDVDAAFVNPPPEEQERIAREARELQAVWATPAAERAWASPFVRPVPNAANSAFGTRSIFNGELRSPHGGADFLSPAGSPVAAPNGGRVRVARSLYFTGNTVIIDHGLGLFSTLAHLSTMTVHEEQIVRAGEIVGEVGATGRVTGPHLHWAVRVTDARVDPLSVLALLGTDATAR